MQKKKCRKCKQVKPLSEFYEHPKMADGHLNQCKECKIEYQKRYAKTEAGKATERRRNQKPERKEYLAENARKWRERNEEKYKAQNALNNAVRDGKIEKPDACERCGREPDHLHGHHDDYSKPLEVRWLCPYCHADENPNTDHQLSLKAMT